MPECRAPIASKYKQKSGSRPIETQTAVSPPFSFRLTVGLSRARCRTLIWVRSRFGVRDHSDPLPPRGRIHTTLFPSFLLACKQASQRRAYPPLSGPLMSNEFFWIVAPDRLLLVTVVLKSSRTRSRVASECAIPLRFNSIHYCLSASGIGCSLEGFTIELYGA